MHRDAKQLCGMQGTQWVRALRSTQFFFKRLNAHALLPSLRPLMNCCRDYTQGCLVRLGWGSIGHVRKLHLAVHAMRGMQGANRGASQGMRPQ